MTREEAINRLQDAKDGYKEYLTDEALNMAIQALEQEPCGDAISRQAVDELSKELVHITRDKADFLCKFWEGLQKLPSVTPQPKTGCEGCTYEKTGNNSTYPCSHCSRCYTDKYRAESEGEK